MENPNKIVSKKCIIKKTFTFKSNRNNNVINNDNVEKNSNVNNYFRTILCIKNKYNKSLLNYYFPNIMNVELFENHVNKINEHILSVRIDNTLSLIMTMQTIIDIMNDMTWNELFHALYITSGVNKSDIYIDHFKKVI